MDIGWKWVTVLSYGKDNEAAVAASTAVADTANVTLNASLLAAHCGAQFCGAASAAENPNLEPPPPERIQLISGIYLSCMLLACLIVAFGVDSLTRYV